MSHRHPLRLFASLLILIATISAFSSTVFAQAPLKEKRIYLIDVTGSMRGRGGVATDDIFDIVKNNLASAISHIKDPSTEILIIPYTETVFSPIKGTVADKDTLISQISDIKIMRGDTNIADAWSYGVQQFDSTKVNYMFMCTDGIHNHGPSVTEFYRRLEEWREQYAGSYMFAFYYMLAENAKVQRIKDITDKPFDNIWSVESLDINAAFIRTSLKHRENIYENNSASVSFVSNNSDIKIGDIGIDITMQENPYYTIEKVKKSWFNDKYNFKIVEKIPKTEIPYSTTVDLFISHDKATYPLVFMTPEKISMEIVNKGPSIVYISDKKYEGSLGKINFGKVKFKEPFRGPFKWARGFFEPTLKYPPFSWCLNRDTTSVSKTLYISFNDEAVRSDASIYIYPVEADESDESYLSISSNDLIETDQGYTKDIRIKVLPGLGSHTFSGVIPFYTENLDKVNKTDIEDGILCEWQLKYKQKWTPILWILWIIYTILVIALAIAVLAIVLYLIRTILPFAGKTAARGASSMAAGGASLHSSSAKPRVNPTTKNNTSLADNTTQKKQEKGTMVGNTLVMNPDYVIPNANYANPEGKTVRELGEDLGDHNPSIDFDNEGNPIFNKDAGAPGGTPMDCYFDDGIIEYLNKDSIIKNNGSKVNREKLHNKAFEKIAEKYGKSVDEIRTFKGDSAAAERLANKWGCSIQEAFTRSGNPNRVQRVLHECADCKTVQLVPRLYHNTTMASHVGGIERAVKTILNNA